MKTEHKGLIERILTGNLSDEDAQKAAKLIDEGADFQENLDDEMELWELATGAPPENEDVKLRALINGIDEPVAPVKPIWARYLKPMMAAAAALFLFGFPTVKVLEYQDAAVAQRAYQPPFNDIGYAGQLSAKTVFTNAEIDFFANRYSEAYSGFKDLQSNEEYRSRALYYLPIVSFRLEEYERAKSEFALVRADTDILPAEQKSAAWFNLLNDLALGEDVRERLERIEWDEEEKAFLRKELNSFWRW